MEKIFEFIFNMMPYMLFSLPIILIFRVIRIKLMRSKDIHTTLWHEIGLIVFFIFLFGLASQTVIPKLQFGNTKQLFANSGMGEINLIPFRVIPETYRIAFVDGHMNYFIINFLGNMVMFMPIGFFVPLLWNKASFKKTVLIGFLSSLFVEISQIPQPRSTDIDDLWLNVLGVIAGYATFFVI